jgi:hypothetical protein
MTPPPNPEAEEVIAACIRELTRDYAVEAVGTSSPFPRLPPLGCGRKGSWEGMPVGRR